MPTHQENMNKKLWDKKRKFYPYQAITNMVLKPEAVADVHILRVPFKSKGQVYWGFRTIDAWRYFHMKIRTKENAIVIEKGPKLSI